MIEIVNDALPDEFFNQLKQFIFCNNFPWFYGKTTIELTKESIYGNSFQHLAVSNGNDNSYAAQICKESLRIISNKLNIEIENITRVRVALLEPKPFGKYINPPHIDTEEKHYVGLLYLNDTDGETVLYNELYDKKTQINEKEYLNTYLKNKVTEKIKINSEQNKFILFEGERYHSSTCPTNVDRRVVINYNFTIK